MCGRDPDIDRAVGEAGTAIVFEFHNYLTFFLRGLHAYLTDSITPLAITTVALNVPSMFVTKNGSPFLTAPPLLKSSFPPIASFSFRFDL